MYGETKWKVTLIFITIIKEANLKTKQPPEKKRGDNRTDITYWKEKCWKEFSMFIRLRDSKLQNREGMVKCCTCEAIKPIKEMQAGHFIPGRNNSILLEETCCHAQCYRCNCGLKGNPRKYQKFMEIRYGQEEIDRLDELSTQTKPMKWFDWKEQYEYYKEKVKTQIGEE